MLRISTDRFFWSSAHNTFSAEASDLADTGLTTNPFELVSSRTGIRTVMDRSRTHRDGEGEITHWTFVPRNRTFDFSLVIFND